MFDKVDSIKQMEQTIEAKNSLSSLEKNPIFILGAQRSGTTLLRLIINNHSEVAIPEEGTFWMPLLRKCKRKPLRVIINKELEAYLKYIGKNKQFKLWGIKPDIVFNRFRIVGKCTLSELMSELYILFAAQHNKNNWGDKTPSFFRMISILSTLFPGARFINIIRDGRDVYLSLKNINLSNNIAVAAYEWLYKVKKVESELEKFARGRYLNIRYEDLVTNPKVKLTEILSFLDLTFEKRTLDYWKNSTKFIGNHHSDLIFKPISNQSVGKWKIQLTEYEQKIFSYVAGATLKKYEYENVRYNKISPILLLHTILLFALGLPFRGIQVLLTLLRLGFAAKLGLETEASGKGKTAEKFPQLIN